MADSNREVTDAYFHFLLTEVSHLSVCVSWVVLDRCWNEEQSTPTSAPALKTGEMFLCKVESPEGGD